MRIARHIAAVAVASTLALGGLQAAALADTTPSGVGPGQGNTATTPSGNNAGTPSGNNAGTPSGNNAGTPSGNNAGTPSGDGNGSAPGSSVEQYLDSQYKPLAVKVSAVKVVPGQEMTFEFTWTEKDRRPAYDAVNVEVHSKVYKLGKHKLDKNGKVAVKWTVPADMALGVHKVLVPEAEGRVIATFEVVKADEKKADAKGNAKGGLAKTGATGVLGALVGLTLAGGAALAIRRRSA